MAMRADITEALRDVLTKQSGGSNPFTVKDRAFAGALLEVRASLAKIEEALKIPGAGGTA